jgi:hypothetical protein
VGQLVAETLRFYGDAFWLVLPLGIPIALTNQIAAGRARSTQLVVLEAAVPLLTAAYIGACLLVGRRRPPARVIAGAFAIGAAVMAPVPFLMLVYVLPAVAWLALLGLAVPAVVLERQPLRRALARGIQLARGDYVHALGSLATLAILFGITKVMLVLLLRGQADNTERVALFLADLVLSPVLFVGAALLYFDQAARAAVVESATRPRRRDADVHPALEPDGAGRPDAEGEPRPPARGQP